MKTRNLLGAMILSGAIPTLATPFEACPDTAFLIQDKYAQLYAIQLSTGFYEPAAPAEWTDMKLNALAFNVHDQYLYAYNDDLRAIVKIDANYRTEILFPANLPDLDFIAGDIAVSENAYYVYRKGSDEGLYRISLDPQAADYLQATQVITGKAFELDIFDLSFHPYDGMAYTVDKDGELWKINVSNGDVSNIGNIGVNGYFGGTYFDNNGHLYVADNSDGYIYRVDTQQLLPKAELFSYGPSSNNNDGARCPFAPVNVSETPDTDFGSAPDSYGTSFGNNGARHGRGDGTLFLGEGVNYEPDAYLEGGAVAAEENDGVAFINNIAPYRYTYFEVTASAKGELNIWGDWNQNGVFDEGEHVISDKSIDAGKHLLHFKAPKETLLGETWLRVRLSSPDHVTATGGVADGEVEDYKVTVEAADTLTTYYPGAKRNATLAFEDNWPLAGDYDMNDVVIKYNIKTVTVADNIASIRIKGHVAAMGASYHNGFAFRIPGLPTNAINILASTLTVNGILQPYSPIEPERADATAIIASDLHDYVTSGEACKFYRTENGCGSGIQMEFQLDIPVIGTIKADDIDAFPFDPFLFATEGFKRNYVFGEAPGRRFEIHLKDKAPTEAFQQNFFGRGDDASDPGRGEYFANANGMPWALNIPYDWDHPVEYMDIKWAYPQFHENVTSGGANRKGWYKKANALTKNTFRK
ncbi:LruC domain-containing protein [Litorivivens sp.]|uniref:LruC domain-containing protein n=1 Tax=Litorivivens sp. TaxID=2020868 RepID=UPI0035646B1E